MTKTIEKGDANGLEKLVEDRLPFSENTYVSQLKGPTPKSAEGRKGLK